MSNTAKPKTYKGIRGLIQLFRDDLNNGGNDFILLYAYNGTGKTRLSMSFKDHNKRKGGRDTLYFNAFTEDLFRWDNDLPHDSERKLHLNTDSRFFNILKNKDFDLETRIFDLLKKYADFWFDIDPETLAVSFSRNVNTQVKGQPTTSIVDHIKVSRGEENLFIWCTFLAICELAIDQQQAYDWVKFIYIDDPISSLDDNNVIALASDLAKLLRSAKDKIKVVISTHHGLFFNIMCNELKKQNHKSYFLYRNKHTDHYQLQSTGDTPFFYHVAMLKELKDAAESGQLYTYHFNILRSIMEKTAAFFGAHDFSFCLTGIGNETRFARALNLLSHGQYSVYDPKPMQADNQKLFGDVLEAFLQKFPFQTDKLNLDTRPQVTP